MSGRNSGAHCRLCGAALPTKLPLRLGDIPGNAHVKRALEVSWTGGHSIGIFGNDNAVLLGQWAAQHKIIAYVTALCPCGGFMSATRECICSLTRIRKWRNTKVYQSALTADIAVQTFDPSEAELVRWASGTCEPDETVQARVEKARVVLPMVSKNINSDALSLLKIWAKQTGGNESLPKVRLLARTIAALADEKEIKTHHVAEAIQYRVPLYWR